MQEISRSLDDAADQQHAPTLPFRYSVGYSHPPSNLSKNGINSEYNNTRILFRIRQNRKLVIASRHTDHSQDKYLTSKSLQNLSENIEKFTYKNTLIITTNSLIARKQNTDRKLGALIYSRFPTRD